VGTIPLVACAPASTAKRAPRADAVCPADPAALVVSEAGEVPLVITSTHAGLSSGTGCDPGDDVPRPLAERVCDAGLDEVCQSGPCRSGGPDGKAREITFAVVDELAKCLGGRPALVLSDLERSFVDMNRDAYDAGGARCSLDDAAALPYWEAFHRAIEARVAEAVEQGGSRALLVDLHTYNSLPDAPPPAVMVGAGEPFGLTVPHLVEDDPALELIFGPDGLRTHLLDRMRRIGGNDAQVFPLAKDAPLDGLFKGRYVVHRYSRRTGSEVDEAGPAVDSIQIEVSSGLRDDPSAAAHAVAKALCDSLGPRITGERR
jgi:hypothetical protein